MAEDDEAALDPIERPVPKAYMLTTVDNPFDPFTQFDEWFGWDQAAGYCTSGMLARIAAVSSDLSEVDQHLAIQDAIDEIVRENVSGMWKKVLPGDVKVETQASAAT